MHKGYPCSENARKLLISHPSKLNTHHRSKNGRRLPIFVLGGLPRRRAAAGVVSSAFGTFSPLRRGEELSNSHHRARENCVESPSPLARGEGGRRPGEGRSRETAHKGYPS